MFVSTFILFLLLDVGLTAGCVQYDNNDNDVLSALH